MPRLCAICGKGPMHGRMIVRKGLRKVKGGIGLHTTGINIRKFKPNLHRIRVRETGGGVRRRIICARCIKSGRVQKA